MFNLQFLKNDNNKSIDIGAPVEEKHEPLLETLSSDKQQIH